MRRILETVGCRIKKNSEDGFQTKCRLRPSQVHSKGGLRLEAHVIGAISFSSADWAFAGSRDRELSSGKVCALSPRVDALLLVGLAFITCC